MQLAFGVLVFHTNLMIQIFLMRSDAIDFLLMTWDMSNCRARLISHHVLDKRQHHVTALWNRDQIRASLRVLSCLITRMIQHFSRHVNITYIFEVNVAYTNPNPTANTIVPQLKISMYLWLQDLQTSVVAAFQHVFDSLYLYTRNLHAAAIAETADTDIGDQNGQVGSDVWRSSRRLTDCHMATPH